MKVGCPQKKKKKKRCISYVNIKFMVTSLLLKVEVGLAK